MNKAYPANTDIADVLERIADLLEAQDANPYRVNAYRRGAKVISTLSRSAAEMASGDDQKLEELPDIGKRIAAVVKEYADAGLSSMLERLENQISAEDLFTTVPGICEALARRIMPTLMSTRWKDSNWPLMTGDCKRLRASDTAGPNPFEIRSVRS